MSEPADVLPGRATPLRVTERHAVNGNRIVSPFPEGTKLDGGRLCGRFDAKPDV